MRSRHTTGEYRDVGRLKPRTDKPPTPVRQSRVVVDEQVMLQANREQVVEGVLPALGTEPPMMEMDSRLEAVVEFADTAGAGPDGAANSERDRAGLHSRPNSLRSHRCGSAQVRHAAQDDGMSGCR
jgi:hypothetical protein